MGKVGDTVHTINSVVRTMLFTVLLLAAGFVGWKGYSIYNEPQQKLDAKEKELADVLGKFDKASHELAAAVEQLAKKTAALERAETSLRLLKLSHRIARLYIVDQQENSETERVTTTVEFYEVNDEGAPIDDRRRTFEIEGDRIYIECLVAKFEDKYVEAAELDRATAICLMQRIFGEYQQPHEGHVIDQVGTSPTSYARGGQVSEFEQQIWRDFWLIADDRQRAAELGIRAAQADAPSTRVKKGATYELELRSTGEFTLRRIDDDGE